MMSALKQKYIVAHIQQFILFYYESRFNKPLLLRLPFIQCCCRHQIRLRLLSHWLESHYLQCRITKTTSRLRLLLSYDCFLHCTTRFSCSSHHSWDEREWRFLESDTDSESLILAAFESISRLERQHDEEWSEEWSEEWRIWWQWGCSLTVLLLLFIPLLSIPLSCFRCSQSPSIDSIMFLFLTKLSSVFFLYREWFWKRHKKPLTHLLQLLVCDSHVDVKCRQLIG